MPIELGSFSLGAVAGGIVVKIIDHFLAKSRTAEDRGIKAFNDAASRFTDAFIDELTKLEVGGKDAYIDILRPAIQKHKSAVHIFRQAITSDIERAAFDKAWEDYYENKYQPNSPLRQYSPLLQPDDGLAHAERRPLAISRIKKLLEFTEKQ